MKKNKFSKVSKMSKGKMTEAQIQEQIAKYSKMSRQELIEQMHLLASQGKASGELDNEQLDNFYSQASGMLSENERNNLKGLVGELKD
ncbi:MAG: hypothetical protein PUG90_04770 [Clostridia bacterium]|nr:hypothetical protein [Clostridia bacterium]MDY4083590.1 hypothetical protein [Eubacteriales bacterium]